ncbi:MAG: tandem-95 repeat protein, partial [Verrucomicrobia bacterium]|nr:tandem-95 repeat protein [Verrucomicrobiota bacterium]
TRPSHRPSPPRSPITGAPLPGWPVLTDLDFFAAPAIGDLDRDGKLEVAIPSRSPWRLHLLRGDGFEATGWPLAPSQSRAFASQLVLGDVNGDRRADLAGVLAVQPFSMLYFESWSVRGGVAAWNLQGEPLRLSEREEADALAMEFTYQKGSAPVIADLDGDGKTDIAAASVADAAYSLGQPPAVSKRRFSLYVWGLDAPYRPETAPWPQFHRDPAHTGYIPPRGWTNYPPQILPLPSQLVRSGTPFFPIELDRFAVDPDDPVPALKWTVDAPPSVDAWVDSARKLRVEPKSPDWEGEATVRLTATDPKGASAEAEVSFAARADYVPPEALPDRAVGLEDEPIELDLLANDVSPEHKRLSLAMLTRPLHGAAVIEDAAGRVRYAPEKDYNGPDSFQYVLRDESGGMAMGEARVNVLPVPDPPAPQPDRVLTPEDTPADFDPLENDADPDGDPVRISKMGRPEHGELHPLEDGKWEFVPAPNWNGTEKVAYDLTDAAGLSAQGQITFRVVPRNDPPEVSDQTITLNRNASKSIIFAAKDPDGDKLSFHVEEPPRHGELWMYPDVAAYYPEFGYAGEDSFTYTALDPQGAKATGRVTLEILPVNNPPEAASIELVTKTNRPVAVTFAAEDADRDPVSFEIVALPGHGRLEGGGSNYVYTPEPGFLGEDAFEYLAFDGKDRGPPAEVSVRVTNTNTPPIAEGLFTNALMNATTKIVLPAHDPEGDPLTFRILEFPRHGELEGEGAARRYTPAPDYMGPDKFVFEASDGEAASAPGTVALVVAPPNTPPKVEDQQLVLAKGEQATIPFEVEDPDSPWLEAAVLRGPRHGLLTGVGINFIYIPDPEFEGTDSFTFQVWDGFTYSEKATYRLILSGGQTNGPRIGALKLNKDGTVSLRLEVRSGQTYRLESSEDLRAWETIYQFTPDRETMDYVDERPRVRSRFYRLLEE